MRSDMIATSLLGRKVQFQSRVRGVPNKIYADRATREDSAEIVAVRPGDGRGLLLTVVWDDGTLDTLPDDLVLLRS